MLEAREISMTFADGRGRRGKTVLDRVSLRIAEGETLGLMGPSGCGKSTLARILLRLIDPDSGAVLYGEADVTRLRGRRLSPFRKEVQLISQHPESSFDPSMRIGDSLLEPYVIHGLMDRTERAEAVSSALGRMELGAALLRRFPHQVSGGEIQRLAICRALALKPRVLVLDEPTSMLDVSVQAQVLHLLKRIQRDERLSCLFISHDEEVARWISDRVVTMDEGKMTTSA